MPGEFMPVHSFDRFKTASEYMDRVITRTGGVAKYLLELQIDQARTANGRAELIRLQRVGSYIASPDDDRETPQSRAFYEGALISSALLMETAPEGEFTGGTLALNHYNTHFMNRKKHSGAATTQLHGLGFRRGLAGDIEYDVHEWPEHHLSNDDDPLSEKTVLIEHLYHIAAAHISELYGEDDDLYDDALTGFWIPLQETLTSPAQERTLGALASVNKATEHVPVFTELEHDALETLDKVGFYSIHEERVSIMKAFIAAQKGLTGIVEYTEVEQQLIDDSLATLNRNEKLFDTDDFFEIKGKFFALIQEGEDKEYGAPFRGDLTVRGRFAAIASVEVPDEMQLKMLGHPSSSRSNLKLVLAPALILQDPVFIQKEDDEEIITQSQDTVIAIPLIYRLTDIARLM